MKRMKKSLCALLFSCVLLAGSMPAAAETTAAEDTVKTEAESSGRTVDVTVSVKEGTDLTSGRVIIFYDTDALTLKDASVGGSWDVEDINVDYTFGTKKGASVAWASSDVNPAGGETAAITFEAKDSADGKEVAFETVVAELYDNTTSVDISGLKPAVTSVKIEISKDPGTSVTPPPSGGEPDDGNDGNGGGTAVTKPAASQNTVSSSAAGANTGDNANFANIICLIALGCVVLAYAARKQISALHKK